MLIFKQLFKTFKTGSSNIYDRKKFVTLSTGRLVKAGVTKLTSDDDTSLPLMHKRKFMITDILNNSGNSRPGSPAAHSDAKASHELRDSLFSR